MHERQVMTQLGNVPDTPPASLAPADMTLDELRPLLVQEMLADVIFDGWGWQAAEAAAGRLNVPAERTRLLFPEGVRDMVDAWVRQSDEAMVRQLEDEGVGSMKIRDRIRRGVEIRIEQSAPYKEAVREALEILARPKNSALAAKQLWRTADRMWRAAGDTSTDYNHYTKRATLSAVYSSTLLYWLQDDSEDFSETRAFLGRRIDNVMQFEKVKADLLKRRRTLPSLTRFLGRLRYPAV